MTTKLKINKRGGVGGGKKDSLWLEINVFFVEGPELLRRVGDERRLAGQTLEHDGAHAPQVGLGVVLVGHDHLRGLWEGSRWESHRLRNQPVIQLSGQMACNVLYQSVVYRSCWQLCK